MGMQDIGRPFAGPPGIPQDRLKILREAFEKAKTMDVEPRQQERIKQSIKDIRTKMDSLEKQDPSSKDN